MASLIPGSPYGSLNSPKMFGSGGGGNQGGPGGGKMELWIKETLAIEGTFACLYEKSFSNAKIKLQREYF